MDIIEGRQPDAGESEWVFPSPTGRGPLRAVWRVMDGVRERTGISFRPHDLRRTAATRMTGDLGISRLVVSKILNHVERGVTAVYDRHSYDREKRQALEAWDRRLGEIVRGKPNSSDNVVSLGSVDTG